MEDLSLSLDSSLPVGVRFLPTDEEIIRLFLPSKLNGWMIPYDPFLDSEEYDLYGNKEPWKLFDKNLKQSFYVFTKLKKKNNKGSMTKRTGGIGTWDGQNTEIVKDCQGRSIGFKKLLVFQVQKGFAQQARGNGHWIMHEFSVRPKDEYVICRIRNKDLDKENPRTTTIYLELDTSNYKKLHPRKRSSAEEENYQRSPKRFRGSGIEQDSVIQSQETVQNCSNSVQEYNPPTNTIINVGEKESTCEVTEPVFDELDDISAADQWDSILDFINSDNDQNGNLEGSNSVEEYNPQTNTIVNVSEKENTCEVAEPIFDELDHISAVDQWDPVLDFINSEDNENGSLEDSNSVKDYPQTNNIVNVGEKERTCEVMEPIFGELDHLSAANEWDPKNFINFDYLENGSLEDSYSSLVGIPSFDDLWS